MNKKQKLEVITGHQRPIKAQFSVGVILRASTSRCGTLLMTHHCLLGWGKNGRCVVGDANGDAAIVGEPREPFDAGEVKAQAGGAYLHSEASFRLRFGAQRAITGPGICAAINFTGEAKLSIQAEDSSRTVRDHIVLGKQLSRRCQDGYANIAEGVEPAIVAKLLAD